MDIKKGKSKNKNELSMSVRTAVGNVTITPSKVAEMIGRIVARTIIRRSSCCVSWCIDIREWKEQDETYARTELEMDRGYVYRIETKRRQRSGTSSCCAISDYKDEFLRKIEIERVEELTKIANDDKKQCGRIRCPRSESSESNKEFAIMLHNTVVRFVKDHLQNRFVFVVSCRILNLNIASISV